jgi:hypothetical protein
MQCERLRIHFNFLSTHSLYAVPLLRGFYVLISIQKTIESIAALVFLQLLAKLARKLPVGTLPPF